MAEITASLVKELREKTGAGMMDCKKALGETAGDIEEAVDWLRTKGLSAAAKKAGRVAAEGLVGVASERHARRRRRGQCRDRLRRPQRPVPEVRRRGDQARARERRRPRQGRCRAVPGHRTATSQDELTNLIATIGENMSLRRAASLSVSDGVVVAYIHNAVAPDLGKIGVLVALESTGDKASAGGARPSSSPCMSPRPTRSR